MKRFIYIFALLSLTALSLAAETSFTVIPPRSTVAGGKFSLTYRLKNAEGSSLSVPEIEGCTLLYGPTTSTMQSYENYNGRQTSSVTHDYTYIYLAEKPGTYTIPAASIVADGKRMQTQPTTIKVLPPDQNADNSQQQRTNRNNGLYDSDASADNAQLSSDDVFIRIILNKSRAYKEEAIECTMKLYTKYSSIRGISAQTPPTFDGFLITEIDDVSQNTDTEHYKGKNYLTAVLKKYIIFPQKTGKLTINSGKYDITVEQYERVSMGFFTTARPVEKVVHVNPGNLSLEILPLPEPAPASFSGAVGKYDIRSTLSSTQLRTGEAATYTLTVSGSGDIKYLHEPTIDFPSEFELYTPKNDQNTHLAGSTVAGTSTFEYTFVPTAVGDFEIPPCEFVYFDPAAKHYVTLHTEGYTVKVARGAASAASTAADRQDIKAKLTDIRHIEEVGSQSLSRDTTPLVLSTVYWLIWVVMALALAAVVMFNSRRIRLNADIAGTRRAKASKYASKRLKTARRFLNNHDNEHFYEELSKAIWGFLADKLSISTSQLTRQNVTERLVQNNVPQDLVDSLIEILDRSEMARFTPDMTDADAERTFNSAAEVISKLNSFKF